MSRAVAPDRTLRPATPADAAAVRTVLARALADDPLMRCLSDGTDDRASSVALWLTPLVDRDAALGRGRVVIGADSGVVAAAGRWARRTPSPPAEPETTSAGRSTRFVEQIAADAGLDVVGPRLSPVRFQVRRLQVAAKLVR